MLSIKEYSPYKVILVDEDGNESTLTTTPPNWFDLDVLETILGTILDTQDVLTDKVSGIIGMSVRGEEMNEYYN